MIYETARYARTGALTEIHLKLCKAEVIISSEMNRGFSTPELKHSLETPLSPEMITESTSLY